MWYYYTFYGLNSLVLYNKITSFSRESDTVRWELIENRDLWSSQGSWFNDRDKNKDKSMVFKKKYENY